MRTWLTPDEQVRGSVHRRALSRKAREPDLGGEGVGRPRLSEGLRLDVGRAAVELHWTLSADGEWRPLSVRWDREGIAICGWWREEPGWLFAYVSEPAGPPPVRLKG